MCWQDCGLCIEEGLSLGNVAAGVSACSTVDVVRSGCAVELHGIGYLLWTP